MLRKFFTQLTFALLFVSPLALNAAENKSHWIWTGEANPPVTEPRYFRKLFALGALPSKALLTISCGNQYEVYVNDQLVGSGNEYKAPGVYDAAKYLVTGTNVIAVLAVNDTPGEAGLIVDFDGGNSFRILSGPDWRWYPKEVADWSKPTFAETEWKPCKDLGLDSAPPWNLKGWPKVFVDKEDLTPGRGNFINGFRLPEGFVLDSFATDRDTSSVLCMTFNAKGQLLTAAAGSGPTDIRMLEETNGVCTGHHLYYQGLHCQGLCAVGNNVYAVGNGRLYLLEDNGAGHAESQKSISPKALGSMEEHGPHGIVHGPDGHLYMVLGNNCTFEMSNMAPTSPIKEEHLYWGNMQPIQSSNGFMDGLGPPGGRIVRADLTGKTWELIAHGLRNDYDLAFTSKGELFAFDSDMEWDIGLPWYRQNRTIHVPWGANFGWRYGSGKWKNHTPDSLPPMNEVGRGSPTGVEVYNHVAFPEEYRDALILCDWSRARILVAKPQRNGATWKGEAEEFLTTKGTSFPVTDACVGPDGALYFSYGGRSAKGGVFRVRYIGDKAMRTVFSAIDLQGLPEPLAAALNTPQYLSAFGRAAIKRNLDKLGANASAELAAVAKDSKRKETIRARALDFLTMNGDTIDTAFLKTLSSDASPFIRAQAVQRMFTNGDDQARAQLPAMLDDKDPWVLRRACEGLLQYPSADAALKLKQLLEHDDHFVRYAASQALLHLPTKTWSALPVAFQSSKHGQAEALLTLAQSFQSLKVDPKKIAPEFEKMLTSGIDLLEAKPNPDETIILLRAIGLSLLALADKDATPTGLELRLNTRCIQLLDHADRRICMDAAEILGYLGSSKAIAPLLTKMKNELLPREERIHYAVSACEIPEGWSAAQVSDILDFLASPGPGENGASFKGNMTQTAAHLSKKLKPELRASAFNILSPNAKTFAITIQGFNVMSVQGYVEAYKKAATLQDKSDMLDKIASAGNDEAFRTLEKLVDETSPLYDTALTHLMRFNHADAKRYTIAALSSSSRGLAAAALGRVEILFKEDPEDPNMYYGLIVCAARSNEARAAALALLKKWAIDDKAVAKLPPEPEKQIEMWQQVFKQNFKNDKRRFPDLSGEGLQEPERFAKLIEFIKSKPTGNAVAGKVLFNTTAKCNTCHAFKGEGKQLGPELTDVAKRFEASKIVEDIVYPSKVVDARYRQILFVSKDGQRVAGFASAETEDTLSVTNSEAVTVTLKKADITRKEATDQSIMPSGLLDSLTFEQIRDLLAYMESAK